MEPIVDGSGDTKGTPLPASTTPWLADLDRGLAKAVTVGAVIGVTTFTLDPAFAARYDARMSLVHVAFAVAALGCVADVLFGDGIRRGARAFVLVGVVVIVAMPFLFPPDAASPAYPPFVHVVTVAALAAPYAVSPAAGVVATVLLAAALLNERSATVGSTQARWEALIILSAGLLSVTVIGLLRRRSLQIARATRHTRLAQEGDLREAAVTRERDRWDSLVHDRVLGTLLLASRSARWSVDHAGQQLAREALHALATPPERAQSNFGTAVRHRASTLGLVVDVTTSGGSPPDDVLGALIDATGEALTNVARHAGVRRASVVGRHDGGGWHVVVTDEGRGFDPHADSGQRAGLRLGIDARLRSVGGTASVDSSVGQGTRVVLDVPTPEPDFDEMPTAWAASEFRPALACAAISIIGHAAIGLLWLDQTRLPWLAVAGLLTTFVATVLAWYAPSAERHWVLWALVGLLVPTLQAANLLDPQEPDWRTWFVGYQNVLVGTLAFRGNVKAAFAIALGMPVCMSMAVVLTGGGWPVQALVGGWPQVLVWAVVGVVLRRALDSAAETIAESERARSSLRLAQSVREVRDAERAERLGELEANVVPMLHRLCRADDLTPSERSQCQLLEAAGRDWLVARCLVTPEVAAAVARSRERGATVEIIASVEDSGPAIAAFRGLVTALLPLLGPGSQLRATWKLRAGEPVGTVVLVGGTGSTQRITAVVDALRHRHPHIAVDASCDEEAAMVVLEPTAHVRKHTPNRGQLPTHR